MSIKVMKTPDSDVTARKPDTDEQDDLTPGVIHGPQTSNKSGKHSSVEKLAASRPELATGTGAKHKAGAFGKPELKSETPGAHGVSGKVSNKVRTTRKKT